MNAAHTTGIIVIALVFIAFLGYVLDGVQEKRTEAYGAYEHCVEREYSRTVASYYQEHGETPECTPTQADY